MSAVGGPEDARTGIGQHPEDLLPAYVLDALDPAEAALVAAHVERCLTCGAEVHRLRAVVDRLPLAARPLGPPPASRARLLDRVRRDSLDRARKSGESGGTDESAEAAPPGR